MERISERPENQKFWTPELTDSFNLALRYPLLPYFKSAFVRFVSDVEQTHTESGTVQFEGFARVSEGFVRLHLVEYASHYINKYNGDLPQDLQDTVQKALRLAFNDPQNLDNSTAFHFPFITESYMYRTVWRQLGTVHGEYLIESLNLLSNYLEKEAIVMIMEDVINGTSLDLRKSGISTSEAYSAYGDVLWRLLPDISRYGSHIFGSVLAELVIRADKTLISYTYVDKIAGREEERNISRRMMLMHQVSRLLGRGASGKNNVEIADAFIAYVAGLQRDRELDEYWSTFIKGTPQTEGTRNFIRATFFHWDIAYKQQIISEIRTASGYLDFQAEELQDLYITLINELYDQEQDATIKQELEDLRTELEQIDTSKAKEQWKEAQAKAKRERAQRERKFAEKLSGY